MKYITLLTGLMILSGCSGGGSWFRDRSDDYTKETLTKPLKYKMGIKTSDRFKIPHNINLSGKVPVDPSPYK